MAFRSRSFRIDNRLGKYFINGTDQAAEVSTIDSTVSTIESTVDSLSDKARGCFSTNTGQTTLTTSWSIMNIGTENYATSGDFTLSSSRVTVNKTGLFLITYNLTTDCTSGSARTESQAQLYENATAVQGTFGGMYNRIVDRGLSHCGASIILDVTDGDIFDVRALKTGSDTVVQAQNGLQLTFVEL